MSVDILRKVYQNVPLLVKPRARPRKTGRSRLGGVAAEEVQHLAVELVVLEFLVLHVGTTGVHDAERPAQVPHGEAQLLWTPWPTPGFKSVDDTDAGYLNITIVPTSPTSSVPAPTNTSGTLAAV